MTEKQFRIDFWEVGKYDYVDGLFDEEDNRIKYFELKEYILEFDRLRKEVDDLKQALIRCAFDEK